MDKTVIKQSQTIMIDSSACCNAEYCFSVEKDADLIIKINGDKKISLNFDVEVKNGSLFKMLVINDNNEEVTLHDCYNINQSCQGIIAYSQLNNSPINADSYYRLSGINASVQVLSVSISSCKKVFNQVTEHLASQTTANIDNYGVVLKDGFCNMVVKNIISKGYHNCSTHQTNRLLTYDKSATGKILPILYIDDNEVEASHACSLGQPDENQIYYLQSRGLSYSEALRLITIGYLLPITKVVDSEEINTILKEEIESKVQINV